MSLQVDPFHIAYCTNVHPGEGLDALTGILQSVAAVKARVSPAGTFGTGLRLGHEASAALAASPARLEALAEALRAQNLYVFTVNGFPYGDFAAEVVKAAVYRPSWLDAERVDYTVQLAEVMAALPGPAQRSLSTVGGCFRGDAHDDAAFARMAQHLDQTARGLAELADRTGVAVRLCLEPEPGTTLETTDDAVRFFTEHLLPLGAHAQAHLGLCYDCCHQAVLFEDAAENIGRLVAAGVPIGKVQVSSALHLAQPASPEARAALLGFTEPRYFHQTVGRMADGRLLRAMDLPELVSPNADWRGAEAWRTHFHVPIWWQGLGHLSTTRSDWQAAVAAIAALSDCRHLEIETYTWHVIPEAERSGLEGGDLVACVAAEFDALTAHLRTLP
jgi:sugar phosphate isomerase/epimerase